MDGFPRLRDARADATERLRCVVADLSVRQRASPNRRQRFSKIRKRSDARSQQRKLRRIFSELSAQPSRSLEQRRCMQQFFRIENNSRPLDFFEPFSRISQPAKTQFAASAQPFPRFANQPTRRFERAPVRSNLQPIHIPPPQPPQPPKLPHPAFARHKSIPEPDQFEQPRLPSFLPYLDIDPRIEFRFFKKFSRHAKRFSARIFRAPRHRGHHAGIASAANLKS